MILGFLHREISKTLRINAIITSNKGKKNTKKVRITIISLLLDIYLINHERKPSNI
jgi:hypothetical protein